MDLRIVPHAFGSEVTSDSSMACAGASCARWTSCGRPVQPTTAWRVQIAEPPLAAAPPVARGLVIAVSLVSRAIVIHGSGGRGLGLKGLWLRIPRENRCQGKQSSDPQKQGAAGLLQRNSTRRA